MAITYLDDNNNIFSGSSEDDQIYGKKGTDTLSGNNGNDRIYGGENNDILYGNDGNDTLIGGTGNDTMHGGTGDDTYYVDSATDSVVESQNQGWDTVRSSTTYTLAAHIERLELLGLGAINGTGNALDNHIEGNSGINILTGLAGNDHFDGNEGNDTLFGGAGSDYLDGDLGVDTMYGGADGDNYVVDNLADRVFELQNEGWDRVNSTVSFTLGANVEDLTLEGFAAINGTGNELDNQIDGNSGINILSGLAGEDRLDGDGGNDILKGGAGNDELDGGLDGDTMYGGTDDDHYDVDNLADRVIELQNEGWDRVNSTVSFTLGANIEELALEGFAAITGTGNELDNQIDGNTGNNILSGLAGNDRLYGGSGNDTFYGGIGSDNLEGGLGIDTMAGGADGDNYDVDNSADIVRENLNEGWDNVNSTASFILGANVENLRLKGFSTINGTGNGLDNTIQGNGYANILNGGAGNDNLEGGAGNDTLYGGTGNDRLSGNLGNDTMYGGTGDDRYFVTAGTAIVIENLNEGWDDMVLSAVASFTLGANVENLDLWRGSAALNGTGNAIRNEIYGNENNNVLNGAGGDDELGGEAGNDTLIGGTGNDMMSGGAGNDTFYVDSVGDFVTDAIWAENSEGNYIPSSDAGGYDRVFSSVSYSLDSNVSLYPSGLFIECLTLSGTLALNGTGNNRNNYLTGNTGNNILNGRLGNDNLTGGTGQDSFLFDTVLNSTTNTDSIADFSSVDDTIRLDKTIFTKLTIGTLAPSQLRFSATAADSNDYILYNQTTGALLYDADGNGASVAVQFATLTARPAISAADFVIIA
ncbi:MAG: calcium-binding protein [Desulfoprunum sp.]|nr:calcium-binding protein [Desulfoprunum sp.]